MKSSFQCRGVVIVLYLAHLACGPINVKQWQSGLVWNCSAPGWVGWRSMARRLFPHALILECCEWCLNKFLRPITRIFFAQPLSLYHLVTNYSKHVILSAGLLNCTLVKLCRSARLRSKSSVVLLKGTSLRILQVQHPVVSHQGRTHNDW
jgi:hypothetical protein